MPLHAWSHAGSYLEELVFKQLSGRRALAGILDQALAHNIPHGLHSIGNKPHKPPTRDSVIALLRAPTLTKLCSLNDICLTVPHSVQNPQSPSVHATCAGEVARSSTAALSTWTASLLAGCDVTAQAQML